MYNTDPPVVFLNTSKAQNIIRVLENKIKLKVRVILTITENYTDYFNVVN